MRIVRLTAQNLKRLKAVEITPEGDVVIISGANGAGKTSVLDAIYFAVAGVGAQKDTPVPIRKGETDAHVELDLGDMTVTRKWHGDKSTLVVSAKDGARYPSPQAMLDGLIGRLSFDPLAFSNMSPKDQRATLLGMIDYDVERTRNTRRGFYDDRTEIGRSVTRLKGALAEMPVIDEEVPDEEVASAEVLAELDEAQRVHDARREAQQSIVSQEEDSERHDSRADELEQELERITRLVTAERAMAYACREQAVLTRQVLEETPEPPALDAFQERLEQLEEVNGKVRARKSRAQVVDALEQAEGEVAKLTTRIDELDAEMQAAIASAHLPIEGLTVTDDEVLFAGIPFSQCSSGERLRVSLAMAMALNPELRVLRITDGSLLDSANMALIADMAADQDYQVWIERVDENATVGVHIEDGEVVSS